MKKQSKFMKKKLSRTIIICSGFLTSSFALLSYSFITNISISSSKNFINNNQLGQNNDVIENSSTREINNNFKRNANEKMNSTIVPVDNGKLPKNISDLSTRASLVEYTGGGASKDVDITKINSFNVTEYVRLNTWYLPHGAQITYVVGLPENYFSQNIYNINSSQWKNSAAVEYTNNASKGDLYVTAYSNMIYRNGELLTEENYKLDDIIISGFLNTNNKEQVQFSWTYGLKLNTSESNKTILTPEVFYGESNNNGQLVGSINNSYICVLPFLNDLEISNGLPIINSSLFTNADPQNDIPFNKDSPFVDIYKDPDNNGDNNKISVNVPGTPYATATLDVVESLYSKIVKKDKWASSVKNYEVHKYFEFGAQSFDRNNINYEILSSNNLTGELRVRIKALPVGNVNNIYQNEFTIKGFMDWIPYIIIIATSVGALIFTIIAFILVAQTAENKRYKLIRKSM